jgi:hypothetical protein
LGSGEKWTLDSLYLRTVGRKCNLEQPRRSNIDIHQPSPQLLKGIPPLCEGKKTMTLGESPLPFEELLAHFLDLLVFFDAPQQLLLMGSIAQFARSLPESWGKERKAAE